MNGTLAYIPIPKTDYEYSQRLQEDLLYLQQRVDAMRDQLNGPLGPAFAVKLRDLFRIRNIYHSNAIEGSQLTIGETRLVVEAGLTISGKPLEDSLAARNLSDALDYFEKLAQRNSEPIRAVDVRGIHKAVLKGIDDRNAGMYRTTNVAITGSAYPPPDASLIKQEMQRFTDWLQIITGSGYAAPVDPLTLACAAHAWFVRIHPFIDGNGRTARLIMNLILIRRGYPLTIITQDSKLRYYEALEESQSSNLTPFLQFVLEVASESMSEYEILAKEQQNNRVFAETFVQDFIQREEKRQTAEFEIFQSAMNLLKAAFRQVTEAINLEAPSKKVPVTLLLKDFGTLDFEKFQQLQSGYPAQRTWFFRLDCTISTETRRYLFFFGYASASFGNSSPALTYGVTLFTSFETDKYFYDRLDALGRDDLPGLYEIGYDPASEQFIALKKGGSIEPMRAEQLAREFIDQAVPR